jgi:altronate hydrolase
MQNKIIKLDPRDNALVALIDLKRGEEVRLQSESYVLTADIPAKHKFASADLPAGADVIMYGVLVGKATETIRKGGLLTTATFIIKLPSSMTECRSFVGLLPMCRDGNLRVHVRREPRSPNL